MAIDNMANEVGAGEVIYLPKTAQYNADTSRRRLSYAYGDGRRWTMRTVGSQIQVRFHPPNGGTEGRREGAS